MCRVIRLNSPNINYVIIIGSYIMNVSIFFRVMPSTDPIITLARCYVSLCNLWDCEIIRFIDL